MEHVNAPLDSLVLIVLAFLAVVTMDLYVEDMEFVDVMVIAHAILDISPLHRLLKNANALLLAKETVMVTVPVTVVCVTAMLVGNFLRIVPALNHVWMIAMEMDFVIAMELALVSKDSTERLAI